MHMADALISPTVGGSLWLASGGLLAYCARRVQASTRDNLVPLMGVLGAFVFTAQMINFTIPGTGSSGHLGGGLLLAALLGPHAAFLVLASVLTVQALFFADGGLLALGCNIFNLGFFPAFIAYPLIYKPLVRGCYASGRAWAAALAAAVAGLQGGALGVVLETCASGVTDLPVATFAALMLPIHVAIGVVEGLATAAVVAFVARARPEALQAEEATGLRPVLLGLLAAAALTGGAFSWFASTQPDGLEWSVARTSGEREASAAPSRLRERLAALQEKVAALPDYGFRPAPAEAVQAESGGEAWPAVHAGTSVSGLAGGLLTLALAGALGFALRGGKPRRRP